VDSEVAKGLKGGVHEKPDLPETFHERHTREFGGESGCPPFPQKKIEFGIGGAGGAISACIEGSLAFFSLFLVDILSRSESLPTPTVFLCKFRQIAKPIFSKSGVTHRPPVAPPVLKECCKLSRVGPRQSPLPQPK